VLADAELSDTVGEEAAADRLQIVERRHAVVDEPVRRPERDLGGDVPGRCG